MAAGDHADVGVKGHLLGEVEPQQQHHPAGGLHIGSQAMSKQGGDEGYQGKCPQRHQPGDGQLHTRHRGEGTTQFPGIAGGSVLGHVAVDAGTDARLGQAKVADDRPAEVPYPQQPLAEVVIDHSGHDEAGGHGDQLGRPTGQHVAAESLPPTGVRRPSGGAGKLGCHQRGAGHGRGVGAQATSAHRSVPAAWHKALKPSRCCSMTSRQRSCCEVVRCFLHWATRLRSRCSGTLSRPSRGNSAN